MPYNPSEKGPDKIRGFYLLDKKLAKSFDRLYPRLRRLYVERALIAAVRDTALFDKIFFENMDYKLENI